MYITIRKEVQVRHCRIAVHPDGSAYLTCYADGVEYAHCAHDSFENAKVSAEVVQLGGATAWSKTGTSSAGSSWLSDYVLCFQGGIRLNAEECELVRKQNRKLNSRINPGVIA